MKETIIFAHEKFTHATKKNLFQFPPKNIKFVFSDYSTQKVADSSEKLNKLSIMTLIKKLVGNFLDILKLPRIKLIIPTKSRRFDYVFSNFYLVLSTRKVILGHLEHIGDLVGYKNLKLLSPICLKFLKWYVLSNICKYVFFMSESAKESFQKILNIPQKKSVKLHVIYPTMNPLETKVKHQSKEIRLLYIARLRKINPEYSFYVKGGHLVIKAYKELKKKYNNLKLIFVGYIPPEYQQELVSLKDVESYLQGYDGNIMDIYQKADIFLFPSYIDGFGYTIIEAMANSLPVVCLNNNFAAKELVLNNITGFIVDAPLKYLRFPNTNFYPDWIHYRRFYDYIKKDDDDITLKKFISKIEILLKDKNLQRDLGESGRERLISGNLSF
ncbi:MAG: glycosyltransferase family 4 protein, partial [Candidatus Lokiarchaeota archaeon]|nr:glycosyltransferase family 4 protein [Candidatus Lokiarchaeota archaeon]